MGTSWEFSRNFLVVQVPPEMLVPAKGKSIVKGSAASLL